MLDDANITGSFNHESLRVAAAVETQSLTITANGVFANAPSCGVSHQNAMELNL